MTKAGEHFDQAVRATAAFGELRTDVSTVKEDVKDIQVDVKHIRSGMDRWGGIMVVVGALVSLAAAVVVSVAGKYVMAALGLPQ